jgi:hypothetical protein
MNELIESVRALGHAKNPTSALIQAVAASAAQCLAAATGSRVDIVLYGLVVVSRGPAAAQTKQKVG